MKEKLAQTDDLPGTQLAGLSKAIDICNDGLRQLNELVVQNPFTSTEDEIAFFKTIKPPFVAELVYYAKLYHIHQHWPPGNEDLHKEYLCKSLSQFQQFYEDNFIFSLYWRTGRTDKDQEYFTRKNNPVYEFFSLPFYIKGDELSTGYDLLVASMLAFEKLIEYLREQLAAPAESHHPASVAKPGELNWTDEKVGLVEMAYSIVEKGSCNHGNATITAVIAALETAFNIDLRNHYRIWIAIRRRKTERLSFMEKLLNCFKARLQKADAQLVR
jgi:hypothetical protein